MDNIVTAVFIHVSFTENINIILFENLQGINPMGISVCVCVLPGTSPWSVSELLGGGVTTSDSDPYGT